MYSVERDKFLTEVMGECWHKPKHGVWNEPDYEGTIKSVCTVCDVSLELIPCCEYLPNNFMSWEGFGKLWEWASWQTWWEDFAYSIHGIHENGENLKVLINPDKFADAIYDFLKNRK